MPLDFAEPSPRKDDKAAVSGEDHFGPSKAHAMQLEGQAIPELVRRLGDIKSGRIDLKGVETYLDMHTLVWDRDLLRNMFIEADYKHQGSVDSPAMVAALSGRFPKRKHTGDWRRLCAILLGLPFLVLAEDTQRVAERAGLSDDIWTMPPKALPNVTRRVRAKDASGEWKALGDSGALGASGGGLGTSGGGGATSTSGRSSPDALDLLMSTHASAIAGPPAAVVPLLTSGGLKSMTPTTAEMSINAAVAETGRSTFAGVHEFNDFSQGLTLGPGLGVDAAMIASMSGRGSRADIPASYSATTRSVKAWEASLPPSAITMTSSALGSLRTSIRSTAATQSHFETRTRRLTTAASDMKKTLGSPRENDIPLSRVEPVRDTKTLYNADYTKWGGANGNDRTAPGRWINDHPAGAQADSDPRKYPWG